MKVPHLTLWTTALITSTPIFASSAPTRSPPTNFGVLLFPAFQSLDVFGPLDLLNTLSLSRPINLFLIAETLAPVSTAPRNPSMNPYGSQFAESVLPTHTFATAPSDLQVLLVPGGLGTRATDEELTPIVSFLKDTYPKLDYLITVCTGAGLAARSGILDGRNATTNKKAWRETTALGPRTYWVGHARWVADGNVYSTSGVSAGIDGMAGWMADVYGVDVAEDITGKLEYVRVRDWREDPFAEKWNVTDVPPVDGTRTEKREEKETVGVKAGNIEL